MTTPLKVTLTNPTTSEVVARFGPCDAQGADEWVQQLYRRNPDVDLVPTVEPYEEEARS